MPVIVFPTLCRLFGPHTHYFVCLSMNVVSMGNSIYLHLLEITYWLKPVLCGVVLCKSKYYHNCKPRDFDNPFRMA